jgi:ketosteroid isomerase-like protein
MRIFISYRREDSAGSAGRLHDTLVKQFGPDHVFRDVADIYAGDDFRQAIEREIGRSDVVLVVIGPRWLSLHDDKHRPRIDDPHDLLRLEVASALTRNTRVIPVLVDRAPVPSESALPGDLKALARRNAVEIRDGAWDDDVRRLVQSIKAGRGSWRRQIGAWLSDGQTRPTRWSLLALALAALAVTAVLLVRPPSPSPPTPERPQKIPMKSVWVRNPKLEGDNLDSASRSVREKMESALLKIAGTSKRTSNLEIVEDDAVIDRLLYEGCPDRDQAFRIPSCSKQLAIDRLGIGAEVVPTFRATEKVGSVTLALRIGRGVGIGRMTEKQTQDGFYDALADWGAEQVALYLQLKRKQIDVALENARKRQKLLEGTLFGAVDPSSAEPGGPTSLLRLFFRGVAWAQAPSDTSEQEVRKVLDHLRSALQTRQAVEVAPLYASMTSQQRDALQRYFDNLQSLQVTFSETDVSIQGDTARAAFVREDKFKDKDGESSSMSIRLVAVLVRSDGSWKIQSLQKPA